MSVRSKKAIQIQSLSWLNQLLNLKLTRIQELGSGSVYCQLFQIIHPGSIPMQKVNWTAQNEHQFTNNLRLLQDAFAKIGIKRPLEPLKLAKAKCPDNYELAGWLRKYYYSHVDQTDCTLNSSLSSKPDFSFAHKKIVPKHFNAHLRKQQDVLCECCAPSKREKIMLEKISVLTVKLEMIKEVVESNEKADIKVALIESLVKLSYDEL